MAFLISMADNVYALLDIAHRWGYVIPHIRGQSVVIDYCV